METVSPALEIYIYREGEYLGPFTEAELRRHWANGVVEGSDYVWYEGMAEWITLRQYFGVPAALTSGAIRRGEVNLELVRARFADPVAQPEPAVFEYKGHPSARAGTVIFLTWSMLGLSMLAVVIFFQRIEVVALAGAGALLAGMWQVVRFRNAGSVAFLLACLAVPAALWWLAQSLIPVRGPARPPVAAESNAGAAMVEQGQRKPDPSAL